MRRVVVEVVDVTYRQTRAVILDEHGVALSPHLHTLASAPLSETLVRSRPLHPSEREELHKALKGYDSLVEGCAPF